jgi:toxin ParE1/3/4
VRKREVVFSPEAAADLIGLYEFIAENSGSVRALTYIGRIEKYCRGFELISERGTRRDNIRPGLRIVGFERRATIAFHVEDRRITIDRIFYGGRNIADAF